ncbi:MAG: hypothetical protein ACW967_08825, partial [Candidatus Hodarchaeales archaeon]
NPSLNIVLIVSCIITYLFSIFITNSFYFTFFCLFQHQSVKVQTVTSLKYSAEKTNNLFGIRLVIMAAQLFYQSR